MKNLLKQKFLPINYSRDLWSSFQDLKQGSKTIIEYSEEFLTMQARCCLNEDDDVLDDQYFHWLRIDIQHILTFKNFDNVDEIIQHAIKAEDIANYQARKFSVSKWPVQKTPAKPDFHPSTSSSDKFSSRSKDQNKFTCFHCKQKGHRAFECPKRLTFIEGTQEEPETTDDPKSDESDEVEEIAAETDGALLLVQ